MQQLGMLETIYRYPVKSMAGEELKEAFVGYGGIMGDRVIAFVRAKGIKGFPWHTGREQEDMVLCHTWFLESHSTTEATPVGRILGSGGNQRPDQAELLNRLSKE